MSLKSRGRRRGQAGFTLIELLVVVLIIGILASIAIPQYFKVVERSRLAEAQTMSSQIRQAEERYLVRQGIYATTTSDLTGLDVNFAGSAPTFGMKNYTLSMSNTCTQGTDTEYMLDFVRCQGATGGCSTFAANVSSRYSQYTMEYNRCNDQYTYPGCTSGGSSTNCDLDFAQ